MKKILLLVLLFATKSEAITDVAAACQERLEKNGSIQVHQQLTPKGVCYLSVSNFKNSGGLYRSFLFTSDGELMVFNSYGWGTDADSTGAREFYFFPRLSLVPEFAWNTEMRTLQVTATSGAVFNFDFEDARLSLISNAEVHEAAEIRPDNRGGVDISKYEGLMLDIGFKRGRAPSSVSTGLSLFTDAYGATCNVRNNQIFKYLSGGDVLFKFKDPELKAYLKNTCPRLKF